MLKPTQMKFKVGLQFKTSKCLWPEHRVATAERKIASWGRSNGARGKASDTLQVLA